MEYYLIDDNYVVSEEFKFVTDNKGGLLKFPIKIKNVLENAKTYEKITKAVAYSILKDDVQGDTYEHISLMENEIEKMKERERKFQETFSLDKFEKEVD